MASKTPMLYEAAIREALAAVIARGDVRVHWIVASAVQHVRTRAFVNHRSCHCCDWRRSWTINQ
jgi:hypothetical protein